MSEIRIKRRSRTVSITLHSTTTLATTLRLDDMAGAVLSLGTISTNATTLQMFGSTSEAGTYARVRKVDGSAADLTLTPSTTLGGIYALPDEVYALPYLKIVSATTNSTGTVGVVVMKS